MKIIATLGVFDGVHLGHKKILKEVVKSAKKNNGESLAITFNFNPEKIISPDNSPQHLLTSCEKIKLIKQAGIDNVVVINFTSSFSKISAFDFVQKFLVQKFLVNEVIVGDNFRFGKDKKGNVALLKKIGKKIWVKVKVVQPVKFKGKVISSTRIRKALQNGNIEFANKMLGRNYKMDGIITKGTGIGRKIGFPTANIKSLHEAIPSKGVYAVRVFIKKRVYSGMCNIGTRPTFMEIERDCPNFFVRKNGTVPIGIEVHIFDFNKNIYASKIKIEFLKRIRDEKKFHNTDELINQLRRDEKIVRNIKFDLL